MTETNEAPVEPTPETTPVSDLPVKVYEVILNGPALGLTDGNNVRRVNAVRFENNAGNNQVTFYDNSGQQVAVFVHALAVMEAAE